MDVWTTIKLALRTLVRNKMRTLLTMLGIIIGVGAVIAMLAITIGANRKIMETVKSFGNNVMFIENDWKDKGGLKATRPRRLEVEDCAAIQKDCKHVLFASPNISQPVKTVQGDHNWSTQLIGGSENMDFIQGWKVQDGRFVTPGEVNSAAKVCVIGSSVRDSLFNVDDPVLGEMIRINRIPFKVVGVFEARGTSGIQDQDDFIFMPYTTMMQRIYRRKSIRLIASGTAMEDLSRAKEEVLEIIKQRRRMKADVDPSDYFEVRTQEEIIDMVNKFTRTFTIFLGAVASISLLVGGIGIMNIMLVSVAERIREIGIRMAVGAKGRDILIQFLVEAMTLSFFGGLLGVGFGYIASAVVKMITQWNLYVSPFSIILAISFASAVGIFFGFYPAWKASKLDPIQALRHE